MKKTISILFSLALVSAPAAAFAEGVSVNATVNANVNAGVTTGRNSGNGSANSGNGNGANAGARAGVQGTLESNAKARADQEIQRRDTNLNQLVTRTSAMKRLSSDEKTTLQNNLSGLVSTLTTLQAKIDADTDVASLKTDVQSITKTYRVYMLVLPQARIAASADRVNTIVGQMQTLGTKLEARITASTSTSVTALQSTYTDMQAKTADASTQANAAVSATANLKPDNGDTTIAASNTAALKAARAQIEAATKDLMVARADITTILKGLKVSATTGATVTAQ